MMTKISFWQKTMPKRSLALANFLMAVLLTQMASASNWLDTGNWNTNWYAAGSSSYTISNAQQLAGLAKLVNDGTDSFSGRTIRLSPGGSTILLSGRDWSAIGTKENPFSGSFDGNGRLIQGMTLTNNLNYQGLFGYVYGAGALVFTNIQLDSVVIKGGGAVGGLAGLVYGPSSFTTVIKCQNTGDVSGSGSYVGGVIGYFYTYYTFDETEKYSVVSECTSTGRISGSGDYVGGVAGLVVAIDSWWTLTVLNCSSIGDVTGNQFVGGIVGWSEGSSTLNNVQIGEVSGCDYVGGIVGKCNGDVGENVNSVAVGKVTGTGYPVGGILGGGEGYGATVTDCYFLQNSVTNVSINFVGDGNSFSTCDTFESVLGVLKNGTGYEGRTNLLYALNRWVKVKLAHGAGQDTAGVKMWWSDQKYAQRVWPYLTSTLPAWPVKKLAFNPTGGAFSNGQKTISNVTFVVDEPYGTGMPQGLTKADHDFVAWTNAAGLVVTSNDIVADSADSLGAKWEKYVNWIQAAETSWYKPGETSYAISNAQQLAGVAKLVNTGTTRFEGNLIRLSAGTNAIDLSGKMWTAIGDEINPFAGSFDGNRRVIHGMSISNYSSPQGLFGCVGSRNNSIVLTNVNLTGVNLKAGTVVGGLAGKLYATNNSATVAGCSIQGDVSGSFLVGGIVGYLSGSVLNSIYVGSVNGNSYVGGLVGECMNGDAVMNSVFAGIVTGGQGNIIGSILGSGFGAASVNYCYYLKNGMTNRMYAANSWSGGSTNWGTFSNVAGAISIANGTAYGYKTNLTDALNMWLKDRQIAAPPEGQPYLWWSDKKNGQQVWPYLTTNEPVWVTSTAVPVPYGWMATYYPGLSGVLAYEAMARSVASNNKNNVWESYVAGLDPTNKNSIFRAYIGFSNDVRHVWWLPALTNRIYTVSAKTNLTDAAWGPTNSASRFFRVKVEMP